MVHLDSIRRLPPERGRVTACARCRPALTLLMAAALAACSAGPDFRRPSPPAVSAYTAAPVPAVTASAPTRLGAAQHLVAATQVSAEWWRALGNADLDAWIDQALIASPTLAAAQATLRQARELYAAQAGATSYPQVDASAGASRQRMNPAALGQAGAARDFELYNAGIGVRYRLDLAGGNRRALEALAARSEYRRHELDGARLALAAQITSTAITDARLAGQIAATETQLQAQDEQMEVTRQRVALGQAAASELLALRAQTEQLRATLPTLQKQREQSEHLLAILAGQAPGAARVPAFTLDRFTLPAELPLIVPSELVRRRPDIRGAEALLHAANADYGVAVAKLYPQINLSASLGSQALSAGALFGGGSAVWSLIGQLTQPLFNPGLPAEKRASLAALDAAAANYRVVVLGALREVADALRALDHDAQTLASLAAADTAARAELDSVRQQYALGTASYVQVLVARQQTDQSRGGLVAAQAQRLTDSVALLQALGGGATRGADDPA